MDRLRCINTHISYFSDEINTNNFARCSHNLDPVFRGCEKVLDELRYLELYFSGLQKQVRPSTSMGHRYRIHA